MNNERVDSRDIISDYIFYSKYSRVKPDGKKETWNEAVSRVMEMHYQFFDGKIKEENKDAFNKVFQEAWVAYNNQEILGSQRSLQYGGPQLLKNNFRSFNCSGSYCNRIEFFKELMELLLSGCGAGFSVQKVHTEQLPIVKGLESNLSKTHYTIEDSIEGWANSTGDLIEAYYKGYPDIEFDYSQIRPEGTFVSGGFKAPGPEPLKICHNKLRKILSKAKGRKLRPFELHLISCIIADAVISGGIRRSAMISIFDIDDEEMLQCKTGDWFLTYPELCRCNNSAAIYEDTPKEKYDKIFEYIQQYGEPGVVFPADNEVVTNPCCFSGDTLIAVADGRNAVPIKDLSDAGKQFQVYYKTDNDSVKITNAKAFSTGKKELIEIVLSNESSFRCTRDHLLKMKGGEYVSAEQSLNKVLSVFYNTQPIVGKPKKDYSSYCKDVFVVEVKELNIVEEVYDIEVEANEHNFAIITKGHDDYMFSEGVFVHNCETNLFPTYINPDESKEYGWSFCVSSDTKLITRDGIRVISDCVDEEIEIWNGENWSKVKPYQTGDKDDLYRVRFSDGSYLDVTNNHKFLWKFRQHKEYQEATTIQLIQILNQYKSHVIVPKANIIDFNFGIHEEFAYEYGFFQGDGTISLKKNNRSSKTFKYLNCDIFDGTGKENLPLRYKKMHSFQSESKKNVTKYQFIQGDLNLCERLKDVNSGIPEEIFSWNKNSILNYVAGLADADGSCASKGIRIYGCELKLRDLQLLLTKVGICSTLCLFRKAGAKTNYGEHKYDMYFLQITKTNEIPCKRLICNNSDFPRCKGKYTYIKSIEKLEGIHKSYCLTEDKLHQCVFNNILTKQCNLCEINGKKVKTEEDFYKACRTAAILGTFQAAYTENLPLLSEATRKIMKRDALLGVGITGMADNPHILFNERIQMNGARIVKETNKEVAKIIGINEAARTTVVKPSGNSSQLLGTGSGVHAYHFRKYIRNIQANNNEQALKETLKVNSDIANPSFWNKKNETVLSFPIELDDKAMVRTDFSTLDFLYRIYTTEKGWVMEGTNKEHPSSILKPKYRHNVSCTVSVKDNEWKDVADWIWEHRDGFFGLSFLSETGDLDYPQAPYTSYLDEKELAETYGQGAILSSGLIVDGLQVFGDIWTACNAATGKANDLLIYTDEYLLSFVKKHIKDGKLLVNIDGLYVSDVNAISSHLQHKVELRNDWVRRFKKFSKNYFDGDDKKCSCCLKHVNIFHQWQKIKNQKPVDWESVQWEREYKNVGENVATACSGGACELR